MDRLIKGKSLSEKAYEQMVEMIEKMTPGKNKFPSEDDLAKNMGISRATVREALKYLMMNQYITTIHGKGTFAHPSALQAENRMDLCSDFCTMLKSRYEHVAVDVVWKPHSKGDSYFESIFGSRTIDVLESNWLYRANGEKMLFGRYFFLYDYLLREPNPDVSYSTLPQFSGDCMQSTIDYCIMRSKTKFDGEAAKMLGLAEITPLHCWDEQIFDLDDRIVGVGEVFVHPENMKLSVVTRFER
ncbi:MAG: winged helix-turn-helix domain-containing protein [Eubacteriales bacterium]|nr:winged helix-turn-helix domain-containing protein [Eubacteriales bacterium]